MEQLEIAKVAGLFLLSTVKLFFAPGACIAAGYEIKQTILITSSGGIFGILFFYYLGVWAMKKLDVYRNRIFLSRKHLMPQRRIFSRRNRFIIKIKGNFGLLGLALLTPAIISIPIGSVVAARFYKENKLTLPVLVISTLIWSVALTFFSASVKNDILHL